MWPADGVEILNLIDDHSRFCLASVAFRTVKATDVLDMELELERLGVVFKHSTPTTRSLWQGREHHVGVAKGWPDPGQGMTAVSFVRFVGQL